MSKKTVPTSLRDRFAYQTEEGQKEQDWRELEARMDALSLPAPKATPERAKLAAWMTVAAAAAAAILWLQPRVKPAAEVQTGPLHLKDGAIVDDRLLLEMRESKLNLDDGSHIVVQRASRLSVLENDYRQFSLKQSAGLVHYEVAPGGPRHWSVTSTLASIEVVGTEFTVDASEQSLRVDVQHGVVIVRGELVPERAQRLGAGEHLLITAPAAVIAAAPAATVPSPSAKAVQRESTPTELPSTDMPSDEELRQLVARARADELWQVADVARRAGRPVAAAEVLARLIEVHADDPRAPLAAFTLGRLYQDTLHQPAQARGAFQKAISLKLSSELRQDAQLHLVEIDCADAESVECKQSMASFSRDYPAAAAHLDQKFSP